jgi:hypothetical protein
MNCAEVEEQMSAYVMNELQNDLHDKIERHIQVCDSCYAWYCEVTEMAEIWSDESTPVAGLNLVEPVLRQLQSRQQSQPYAHLQSQLQSQPEQQSQPQSQPQPEPDELVGSGEIPEPGAANPDKKLFPFPQFPQMRIQQKKRSLQSRMVYVHYGLAASFTIALFQLGIFEHLGLGIVNNGILLSQQVQDFLHMFSTL